MRYLYKYIENSGAIDKLKEMGIEDGDTIKVFDYEFEYVDEDFDDEFDEDFFEEDYVVEDDVFEDEV